MVGHFVAGNGTLRYVPVELAWAMDVRTVNIGPCACGLDPQFEYESLQTCQGTLTGRNSSFVPW